MKKCIIFLFVLASSVAAFGQSSAVTSQTALTLQKGKLEFGLLHPLVIGVSDSVELVTHPFLDILQPNAGVKVNWIEKNGLYFSTSHSLSYATLFLNLISRSGTGGVLPADNTIPQVFTLDNQILSTYITGNHMVSLRVGARIAAKFPDIVFDTIDYPVLFTNTAAYHAPIVFNVEANYRLRLSGRLALLFDGGAYLMPQPLGAMEIRQTSEVLFGFNQTFSVSAGYLMTYGSYPYGNDWKVFPLVDFIFSFGGK
jgi:hypothetical protein